MARYAAIDIGSNSLRLLVAEVGPDGATTELATDRVVTRLGESVFREGRISGLAVEEITSVLHRMAETIRKFEVNGTRAVATSAVRDTSNQEEFLSAASSAAGTNVEVISGQEEARLIHLGVMARWPHPHSRVLMIDVGGGSAELIESDHGARREAFSKPLGAVRLQEVFLPHDPPSGIEIRRMEEYISEKIAPALDKLGQRPFDRVIGTSGTAAAIACAVHKIPRPKRDTADRLKVTAPALRKLYREVAQKTLSQRRKIAGVGPRRAEIIIPGVAVFTKVIEAFQANSVYYCAAGVRDGIIADLATRGVGKESSRLDKDQRRAVEQMARRYGVPVPHARHVAELAHALFESTQMLHGLAPGFGKLLEASSYLHDVGHYISDSAHHKHSAYIVANSGMPGFTVVERQIVSMLCRFHRKSMPAARHEAFNAMPTEQKNAVLQLLPLLRLADSLDRSHEQRVQSVDCELRNGTVVVKVLAGSDTDLDLWAAERVGDIFRLVYQKPLRLEMTKS